MEAGRELDALVAEKVMGQRVIGGYLYMPAGRMPPCPRYSTDIAAAWQVIERFGIHEDYEIGFENGKHYAKLGSTKGGYAWGREARAATAPHAICLAALKAVGVDIDAL